MLGKENKLWIVLLTHGNWGEELISSAKAIIGEVDNIYSFPLMPDMKVEDYIDGIRKVLSHSPSNTILITDLYCGTTTNVALILSQEYDIKVVTGLNMYLLIQIEEMRKQENLNIEDALYQLIDQNKSKIELLKLED